MTAVTLSAGEPLRYNRDVRPILSDNCFSCHGPDTNKRQSGLRLDVREAALKPAESGKVAIVPGKPEASELVARIESKDAEDVMPPPKSHKKLTPAQKEILQRWIREGAAYEAHWSYMPVPVVQPPAVKDSAWPRTDVDRFILTRLEQEKLAPSPVADKTTLIRRLSLDLTGLPPTPAEVEAFEKDSAPDAYEKVVDRLLKSPHYGERMAVDWLDAARYADTNGYQVDRDREAYAWRDWVIQAFNDNKPFDQFTIEQIAGDLLPNATLEQRIATGFHRNHMMNEEGGVIAEEFLAEYTADRVETTATVWLGQTFNCTRCHDHKFDPFTQRDFYSLKAFYHNVTERGVGNYGASIRANNPPMIKLGAPADLESKVAALKKQLAEATAAQPAGELVKQLTKELAAAEDSVPTALVMQELPAPRPTHILQRGAYDKLGELVTATTPAALPPMAADLPRNRLGLARWLVSKENPLTARVTVNRLWQMVFGTGLVKTSEDFGAQGDAPSHPELLDWLAGEFVRSGWDMKALLKQFVMSATYRQTSRLTVALRERDPENRLLARGPRFRLAAEFVRDQALAASGLLVARIGGPSVRPYHPPGLYEQVTAGNGTNVYVPGKGDDLHRRSLYTYWKRSVPHPAMLAFDASFRETCTVRRSRTNTPLQALNLMNDPTYVEAARLLAQRMMLEGGTSPATRLTRGFRLVLARQPRSAELSVLTRAYDRSLREFQADPAAANELLKVGEASDDAKLNRAELAALTTVASMLFCMDSTITKE